MGRRRDHNRLISMFARGAICALCTMVAAGSSWVLLTASSDAVAGEADIALETALKAPDDPSRAAKSRTAQAIVRRELALSPAKPAAWARLAYAEALEAQALTPEAADALSRSYALAPRDADLVLWRTAFVYRNFTQAPSDLRARAFDEVAAFSAFTLHKKAIASLPDYVEDPSGRFALMLALEGAGGG